MKKSFAILLVLCMIFSFTGCQSEPSATDPAATEPQETEVVLSYENVTAAFVGDSITRGTAMEPGNPIYWELVNEALKFKQVTGLGVNGSCYSVTSEYGLRTQPLPSRYMTIPQADLIFILLGTNDFNMNTPLGTIEDKEDISFYGGMNFAFDRLEENWPNSKIILMTPVRRHGVLWENSQRLQLTDYNDAIKAVAQQRGYVLIDLYEITYEKLTAGVLADAVHPNKYGHQIMGEALTQWLEENIETVLK